MWYAAALKNLDGRPYRSHDAVSAGMLLHQHLHHCQRRQQEQQQQQPQVVFLYRSRCGYSKRDTEGGGVDVSRIRCSSWWVQFTSGIMPERLS